MNSRIIKSIALCTFAFMTTNNAMAQQKTLNSYPVEDMNTAVRPGDNFMEYAAGTWQKKNPLRDDQVNNGAFTRLFEENQKQMQELILAFAEKEQAPGSIGQKIGTLYNLMMDSVRREKEGYTPLMPLLEKIRGVKDIKDYQRTMAELTRRGENVQMFSWYVGADMKQADQNLVSIGQGGLGMPQRDYYLNEDEQTIAIRKAYKEYCKKLLAFVGYNAAEAEKKVEAVYAIEKRIAMASYDNVKLRDVKANYHKMPYNQLLADFPGIDWTTIFWVAGYPAFSSVDIGQPEPIHEVEKILAETSLDDLKSYAELKVLDGGASYLSQNFRNAKFEYEKVMTGKSQDDPLWKRATNLVNKVLSDALGQMYCEKYFPESSKKRMLTLVGNLQKALGQRITEASWMSAETKTQALDKLNNFHVKIGYPDKWKDYSKVSVDSRLSLYENLANISEYFWLDELNRKVNKPVDTDEWFMSPQTINAYYNPTTNEICFPAAILQPPFFDANADDAINYGAIGVVIGHEMSHGFDDQGCQFDKTGNQRNWWTELDKQNFDKRTKVLEEYFSKVEVLNGRYVNGKMTLGENIGDNGGLNISMRALHNAMADGSAELLKNDQFTPKQRFFLAYARLWSGNFREKYVDMLLNIDVHSPAIARVNGALPHIDEWYTAFNIKKSDKLFLAKKSRARVW